MRQDRRSPSTASRAGWLLVAAYGVSGAAGLIYEVCWSRLLTLYMGSSAAAAATVLTAFLAGLALGAAAAGRFAPRLTNRRALQAYVALEAALALIAPIPALVIESAIGLLRAVYADGQDPAMFAVARIAMASALLSIPAALLGATFPFIVRAYRQGVRSASGPGRLYAANTIGAVCGALAAGFVLLPRWGLSRTTLAGASLSIAAALLAFAVARRAEDDVPEAVSPRAAERIPERHAITPLIGQCLAVLSGFAVFAYELVWFRLFGLMAGPSTYAFSTVVAVVIAGLGIGAAFSSSRIAARFNAGAVLAILLSAATLAVAVAAALAGSWLPRAVLASMLEASGQYESMMWNRVLIVGAVMLPPAAAMGAVFPLLLKLDPPPQWAVATWVGRLYAINTAGCLAGSIGTVFFLIPYLGLERTLSVIVVALAAAACVVLARGRGVPVRATAATAVSAAVIVLALAPGWDRQLLSSGLYKYGWQSTAGLSTEAVLRAGELLFYRDGAVSTITVKRLAGETALAVDGKVDASDGGDMLTQKLLAHVPLLLHERPGRVGIIGLGSGVTLASALRHPVTGVDVIELAPEVVEASRLFAAVNAGALADSRTHLIVGDGRSHLLLSNRTYDVLISEPSNPWMAGVAALFTREMFTAMRARLAPGGLVCQWAHTYDIAPDDLRSIVATFVSVFPSSTFWFVGDGDLLLVGGAGDAPLPLDGVERHWNRGGVAADLAAVGAVEPFDLLSLRVDTDAMTQYARGAALQTDDRLQLEFSGPLALYDQKAEANAAAIAAMQEPVLGATTASASAWFNRGRMLMTAAAYRPAFDSMLRAVKDPAAGANMLADLVPAAVASGQEPYAVAELRKRLLRVPCDVPTRVAISKLLAATGDWESAMGEALTAAGANGVSLEAWEQVASLAADAGDAERLDAIVEVMRRLAPQRSGTFYYGAALAFLRGYPDKAVAEATAAIATDPRSSAAFNLLGAAQASLGRERDARPALAAALRIDPHDPTTYVNMGTLDLSLGNARIAEQWFAEALSLDPLSSDALEGLTRARTLARQLRSSPMTRSN